MTKFISVLILLLLLSKLTIGQTNSIILKIDSLKYLDQQPFTCNSVFWRVAATGKDAIPFLIDKLEDTTQTQVSLTCKKTNVKFGDICYEVLTEILNIPLFYITEHQFDMIDQYGCQQGVYNYIDNNRQKFKSQILDYYDKYKLNLKFIYYDKEYKNECKLENNIYGYYDIDWKLLDSK